MLNPYRRTIRLPGRLGASLVTGTEKIRCGYGNGDCLLVDCHHRIFAVADASERFPQASRLLVERLAGEIRDNGPPQNETEFSALLQRIWARQKFIHRTTLSCVAVINHGAGQAVMVANNGDSSVRIVAPDNGRILYRTGADMNFAGRSRLPNPVVTRDIEHSGATLLLASDGIADVRGNPCGDLSGRPHRLGDWIAERTVRTEFDDIGAIALTPSAIDDTAKGIIIMGGTRPGEETSFAGGKGRNALPDRWDDIPAWKPFAELLSGAGIQII
jgi:hypothetical protein